MKSILLKGFLVLASILLVTSSSSALTCANLTKSLAQGSENSDVLRLQQFLFEEGYLSTKPTGYFGVGTFKAVKAFQKANSLDQVGSTGPGTRAKIKEKSCATQSKPAAVVTSKAITPSPTALNTDSTKAVQPTDVACGDDACFAKKLETCSAFTFTQTNPLTAYSTVYNETTGISGEQNGKCKVFYTGEFFSKTTNRKITYSASCLLGKNQFSLYNLTVLRGTEPVRSYIKGQITLDDLEKSIDYSNQKNSTLAKYSCVYQLGN
jgi:peptidoglycan hydrolase-like protein with peptidoglycan-binding domain